MKLYRLVTVFILCVGPLSGWAQQSDDTENRNKLQVWQDSLKLISLQIYNENSEPERYNASFNFIKTLVSALKTPNSYHFGFDSLKAISIQTAPDKKFRIFSWYVMNNDGSYRYYGTIQMNNPEGKLELYPLIDHTADIKNAADTVTNNNKWFGAQYYSIIPVTANVKTPYYVLLGLKGSTIKSNKKVIEILHFNEGKPLFGMAVFSGDQDNPKKKRMIFEYTRQASMVLNYDPKTETIVFDHLAPPDPNLKGKYDTYGPDFSYDGYKLQNGLLRFVSDLKLKNPPTEKDEFFNDPRKMKGLKNEE